ncbi:hypothetical protein [Hymenobacter lucidus]|uniref:Uncharacterized protein n=1 Tax=Hymenobacter lucidus TaxID=2880930 RepID=A0ABS8AN54_9BACT|nr:hypothetical protein [Hymenobacter lucidus]MCB2407640.1 hypothetical protein [Hymenobacter lucidus]
MRNFLGIVAGIAHVFALGIIIGMILAKSAKYILNENELDNPNLKNIKILFTIFDKFKPIYIIIILFILAIVDIFFYDYLFELKK